MREAWAGVASLDGESEAGLGAFDDFAPDDVPRPVAKLDAACVRSRVRAFAIASRDRSRAEEGRSVGGEWKERAAEEADEEGNRGDPQCGKRIPEAEGKRHGAIVLAQEQKTDSAGRPKFLLPGFWNWVEEGRFGGQFGSREEGRFPNQIWGSSELELEDEIGFGC